MPAALYLSPARDVEALPGFALGELSVQDEGAQLAASLLDARPGERILDACAAPGGKTLHLAQQTPDIELVAVESDDVPSAFPRIWPAGKPTARCHIEDACEVDAWWDGRAFPQDSDRCTMQCDGSSPPAAGYPSAATGQRCC